MVSTSEQKNTSLEVEAANLRLRLAEIENQLKPPNQTTRISSSYRAAVEQSQDLIAAIDSNYVYLFANQSFLTYQKRSWDEVVGRKVADVIGSDLFNTAIKPHVDTCLAGSEVRYNMSRTYPDLGLRYLEISYTPVRDEKGITSVVAIIHDITERVRLDEILQESKERYRSVVEAFNGGILLQNQDGSIAICNKASEQILGVTCDQIRRQGWAGALRGQAIHEDGSLIPEHAHPIAVTLRTGDPFYNEILGLTQPAGPTTWLNFNTIPLFRPGEHHPYAAVASFIDITRLKQTQQNLRESEDLWQYALEGAGDGVWDWNAELDSVYYSPRWKAMLGYGEDEIENTNAAWHNLLHPEEAAYVQQILDQQFQQVLPSYSSEFRLRCKDGSYKWILARGKTIQRSADGKPLRIIGTHTDISERKLAEERFEKAFHANSAAMTISTMAEGRYVDVNEAFCRLFGYPRQDVIGKTAVEVGIFADPQTRSQLYRQMQQHGHLHNYEIEGIDQSGRKLEGLLSVETIMLNGVAHFLSTMLDITAQRTAQRANEEASRLIEEQKIALEALNASKDKFFSIIAHDLRGPISSFISLGSIFNDIDTLDPNTYKSLLGEFQTSSNRLLELLDNLLTWARIQRGIIPCDPCPLGAAETLRRSLSLFSSSAQSKQIILTDSLSDDLLVFADAYMIDRIFQNLISNAIKFSLPGTAVEITSQLIADDQVEICFRDHGIGIEPDHLQSLFDISVKSSQPGTSGEKGTGLGLILCKEFVERNKGALRIESQPGQGTQVFIILPIAASLS